MTHVHFLPDDQCVPARAGETILQVALRSGIVHAHACGGHARCSTCRVWVLDGLEHCQPRNEAEQCLAGPLGFSPQIRLACQTRISGDVKLRRLVLDDDDLDLTNQLTQGTAGAVGQEKLITIMFADIRGYTAFSEPLPPYDIIFVLDRFFQQMGRAIYRHGGYIDNYMGDGLMALFGVDKPGNTPLHAVCAALDMLEATDSLKPYYEATYGRSFEIGIGLHTGLVVLGSLGYGASRKLSAIGDAVNMASRVESANKAAGTRLLISADTYQLVQDRVSPGRTVEVDLKGKRGRFTLYEVVGLAPTADKTAAAVVKLEDGKRWVRLLGEQQLRASGREVVKVGSLNILLLRHEERIFALESRCPHLGLPLSGAKMTADCGIVCPWHHSAFDLNSGDVKVWAPWPPVSGAMPGTVRRQHVLRVWPTRIEDGYVWVALNEAQGA